MPDNIQFGMFYIQPVWNMSPGDQMDFPHPWCKFLNTTKPVMQIIPVSVTLFSVIYAIESLMPLILSLFSLRHSGSFPIYPGNDKIYFLIFTQFSHVFPTHYRLPFPDNHRFTLCISIPHLIIMLQIKDILTLNQNVHGP